MSTKKKIITNALRNDLKAVMQKEIKNLPIILEGLEAKERLSVICKLMPFVFPKVETIHPTEGEPFTLE